MRCADPFALFYLHFLALCELFQKLRSELHLLFLKQQDDGGTGKLKMTFFSAFPEACIFLFVEKCALT